MTEDQKVAIDFGQGVDQKSDFAQVVGTKLSTLVNRVFTKAKQLKKDFGFTQILDSNASSRGIIFKDSLEFIRPDVGQIRAYSQGYSALSYLVGSHTQTQISVEDFIGDSTTIKSFKSIRLTGNATGDVDIGVYLLETGELSWVVKSVESGTIRANGTLTQSAESFQVIPFGDDGSGNNSVAVIYYERNVGFLAYQSISGPGLDGAPGSLTADVNGGIVIYDISYNATTFKVFYRDGGTGNLIIKSYNTSFAEVDTVTLTATTPVNTTALAIAENSTTGAIWVAYGQSTSTTLYGQVFDSSLTNTLAETTLTSAWNFPQPSTGDKSATTQIIGAFASSTQIKWLADDSDGLYYVTLTSGGVVGTYTFTHKDMAIASKPFVYGSEAYFLGILKSDFQGAAYVCTFLGLNNRIVAKALIDRQGDWSYQRSGIPFISTDGDDQFYIPAQVKTKQITELVDVASDPDGNFVSSNFGGVIITVDFDSDIKPQHVSLDKITYLTGGITKVIDGQSVVEAGYHSAPEILTSSTATNLSLSPFTISVFQQGTGGLAEITDITCCAGAYIGGGQYFNFNTTTTAYYTWFTKNGAGVDPAPGGRTSTGPVAVFGTDSASDVANKLATVLDTVASLTTPTVTANVVRITNSAVGAVTDAANISVAQGRIASGTYQYVVVRERVDFQGNLHRSAPSLPYSLTSASATTTFRIDQEPFTITDTPTTIKLVLYRTAVDSSGPFYRITPDSEPIYNQVTTNTPILLVDTQADSEISDNEVLYTTGGVLENSNVPPTRQLRLLSNRLFGIDTDQNKVIYSKPLERGLEVSFPSEFSIDVERTNKDLIDIFAIDDKFIVLNEDRPFYFVGPGPNSLGEGGTFSDPEPIIFPVGGRDTGSAVEIPQGVMFSTPKGIYLLGRSLESAFIGADVEDKKANKVLATVRTPSLAQVRFLLDDGTILIYDYDFQQWSYRTFTELSPISDMLIYDGSIALICNSADSIYLQSSGFQNLDTSSTATNVTTSLETGWINVSGIQGYQRVKRAIILGEYKSAHVLTVSVGYDYSTSYSETYTFTPGSTNPLRFEFQIANQKCSAIRFKIEDGAVAGTLLEGNTLTNLTLIVGVKKGVGKLPYTRRA